MNISFKTLIYLTLLIIVITITGVLYIQHKYENKAKKINSSKQNKPIYSQMHQQSTPVPSWSDIFMAFVGVPSSMQNVMSYYVNQSSPNIMYMQQQTTPVVFSVKEDCYLNETNPTKLMGYQSLRELIIQYGGDTGGLYENANVNNSIVFDLFYTYNGMNLGVDFGQSERNAEIKRNKSANLGIHYINISSSISNNSEMKRELQNQILNYIQAIN